MTAKPLLSLQGLNPYSPKFLGAAQVAQLTPAELTQLQSRRSTRLLAALVSSRTLLLVWVLAGALAMWGVHRYGPLPSFGTPPIAQAVGVGIALGLGFLGLGFVWLISEGRTRLELLAPLESPFLVESTLQRVAEYPGCRQYRDQVLDSGRALRMADYRIMEWLALKFKSEKLSTVATAQWNQLHARDFPVPRQQV